MTQEHEIAARITAILDQGKDGLRAGTAYRLQQARAAAACTAAATTSTAISARRRP